MSNNTYTTLDSGKRVAFGTGSVRDTDEGKPRFDLIDTNFLGFLSEAHRTTQYVPGELVACLEDSILSVLYFPLHEAVEVAMYIIRTEYGLSEDHPLSDQLPPAAIRRLAELMARGAQKYGENNWKLGQKLSRVNASLQRHYWAWLEYQYHQTTQEDTPEDHFAGVLFNCMAMWVYLSNKESYPEDLFDLSELDY